MLPSHSTRAFQRAPHGKQSGKRPTIGGTASGSVRRNVAAGWESGKEERQEMGPSCLRQAGRPSNTTVGGGSALSLSPRPRTPSEENHPTIGSLVPSQTNPPTPGALDQAGAATDGREKMENVIKSSEQGNRHGGPILRPPLGRPGRPTPPPSFLSTLPPQARQEGWRGLSLLFRLCRYSLGNVGSRISLLAFSLSFSACASDGNSRLKMRNRDTSCPLLDIVALAAGVQSC